MSDYDSLPIWHLWRAVALKLCGRPVLVRLRHPTAEHADGQAYNFHGQAVVDLSDCLWSDAIRYKVLLHELGHIAAHFDRLTGHNPTAAPGSVKLTPAAIKAESGSRWEGEADKWAAIWTAWADRHWQEYGEPWQPEYTRRLLALLDYPKGRQR